MVQPEGRKTLFASNFTPIFRACDLADFCNNPAEKLELQFVLKYHPFSKYKAATNPTKSKILLNSTEVLVPKVDEISVHHQNIIKKELQLTFLSKNDLKFNDKLIAEKFNEALNKITNKSQENIGKNEIVIVKDLKESTKKRLIADIIKDEEAELEENELIINLLDKYELEQEFKKFIAFNYNKTWPFLN